MSLKCHHFISFFIKWNIKSINKKVKNFLSCIKASPVTSSWRYILYFDPIYRRKRKYPWNDETKETFKWLMSTAFFCGEVKGEIKLIIFAKNSLKYFIIMSLPIGHAQLAFASFNLNWLYESYFCVENLFFTKNTVWFIYFR